MGVVWSRMKRRVDVNNNDNDHEQVSTPGSENHIENEDADGADVATEGASHTAATLLTLSRKKPAVCLSRSKMKEYPFWNSPFLEDYRVKNKTMQIILYGFPNRNIEELFSARDVKFPSYFLNLINRPLRVTLTSFGPEFEVEDNPEAAILRKHVRYLNLYFERHPPMNGELKVIVEEVWRSNVISRRKRSREMFTLILRVGINRQELWLTGLDFTLILRNNHPDFPLMSTSPGGSICSGTYFRVLDTGAPAGDISWNVDAQPKRAEEGERWAFNVR
ncbi:uncharacterized protein LOC106174460 [Lingula anatina]|uniref:Uncharacterized protein LOC106174460 n=1 Tax=Lingula anatina TaxID=7574 RepID=A0A1S3JM69_LINAN|nr:uncharacterized protein LOC106174460 [Lingula anatina]|eukprot:XP_013411483.1 uncharacterized protein LOC106174460 [Lingula anatina]